MMKGTTIQRTTIEVYHGGQHDDPRWFTTDRSHAAYFGEVRRYRLTGDAVRVHADDVDGGADGYTADAMAYAYLGDTDADMLIMEGHEGSGLVVLIDPRWVSITEVMS